MLKVLAVLACLACACHGRRAQFSSLEGEKPVKAANPSHALAMLLQAPNQANAFNLRANVPGTRALAGSGRHRLPVMTLGAGDAAKVDSPAMSRRNAVATLLGLGMGLAAAASPSAVSADSTIVTGSVLLPKKEEGSREAGALYVTARPPGEFRDALGAARGVKSGNPPPIAVARYPAPLKFPFEFELKNPADITPEGQAGGDRAEWVDKDLVIVVRYDEDGVAATRGAGDLVGSFTVPRVNGKLGKAEVELMGRGLVSKFMKK